MSETTKLLELAERVARATEGSFKLDDAIYEARGCKGPFREFSRSIDAAMTLVPEGLFPLLDWSGVHCRLRARHRGILRDVSGAHALAATPALALVAASLRSLAKENEDGR